MQVIDIYLNKSIPSLPQVAMAVGFFDGVHKGHQVLINKAIEYAKAHHCKSAVLTFNQDPWLTLGRIEVEKLVTPLALKKEILQKMGVDILFVLHFTKDVANLSKEAFIKQLIIPLNAHAIVCGFDYRFGKNGEGDALYLKKALPNVEVNIVSSVNLKDKKISTTRIDERLTEGDIETVNKMLTRPFEIRGNVIHGNKKGRTIGYRTANIEYDHYTLPRFGVYAVNVIIKEKQYIALCNIGHNPTFNCVVKPSLEVHIVDFDKDIYGEHISIQFLHFIRPEQRFDSIEKLIKQIEKDKRDIITKMKISSSGK